MKRIYIVILILIIVVLGTTIYMSYGSCNCNSNFILNFLKVFSALQTVFSFIIAYLLYDRFGTSKKLLDKQNEIIVEYIEELKKIHLGVFTFPKDEKLYTKYNFSITRNIWFDPSNLDGKKIVVFETSGNQYKFIQKLVDLSHHPLFPIELKNQMNVFQHSILTNPIAKNYTEYDLAYVSFERGESYPDKEKYFYSESMEISLYEYIKLLEKIIAEIEVWINKESSIKIKLNFN